MSSFDKTCTLDVCLIGDETEYSFIIISLMILFIDFELFRFVASVHEMINILSKICILFYHDLHQLHIYFT